jgi:hypothetical protein
MERRHFAGRHFYAISKRESLPETPHDSESVESPSRMTFAPLTVEQPAAPRR